MGCYAVSDGPRIIAGWIGVTTGFDNGFLSPGASSIADLPPIEPYQSHEGLRVEDNGINMPKDSATHRLSSSWENLLL